jgi:hypothetical protein
MIPDGPDRVTIRPLAGDDDGGYLIEVLDLPGRMSDGETIEQAIPNGRDAMPGWAGRCAPRPPDPRPDRRGGGMGRWPTVTLARKGAKRRTRHDGAPAHPAVS